MNAMTRKEFFHKHLVKRVPLPDGRTVGRSVGRYHLGGSFVVYILLGFIRWRLAVAARSQVLHLN